jgi:hypothetical protein
VWLHDLLFLVIVHSRFGEQAEEAGIDYDTSVVAQAVIDHSINCGSFRAVERQVMQRIFEAREYKVTRLDLSELVCTSRREGSFKAFQATGRWARGVPLPALEQ